MILESMELAYSLEELESVSVGRDGVREKKEQESDMEKGMVCFFLVMDLHFWGNIYLGLGKVQETQQQSGELLEI